MKQHNEAHITAMRNSGWVVIPPIEAQQQAPTTQVGFQLVTQNPLKRKQVTHWQYNGLTETNESSGQPKQIRIRKDVHSFLDPENIQSDTISSATDQNKGQANLPTKVKQCLNFSKQMTTVLLILQEFQPTTTPAHPTTAPLEVTITLLPEQAFPSLPTSLPKTVPALFPIMETDNKVCNSNRTIFWIP